jgi:hypothetical protein
MKKIILYILSGLLILGGGIFVYQKINSSKVSTSLQSQNQPQILQKEIKLDPNKAVCDQIPSAVVEGILGEKVERVESFFEEPFSICQYYFAGNDFLSLSSGNFSSGPFSYEDQKKNAEILGKEVKTNPKIATEHFIVMEKSGYVGEIVLKITDDYFLAIDFFSLRSMHFRKVTSEEVAVGFAANLVNYLQTGKINKINIDFSETESTSGAIEDKSFIQEDSGGAPLPEDEEFINSFYNLIDQGKAGEAVEMLSSQNTNSEGTKKLWQEQFEAIKSVKVLSIEPVMKNSWTDQRREYKVVLDMTMDESSKDAPIPYYGYDQGENTRFITLVKEGDKWFIETIATAP